ncbi:MAG TPA: type 4a pilus biogenesis protein PilO [Mycobacteriales bacterium]|nr:type 4a pilus biogenesis protein PilO [Mycobacteriales bacterium]
MTRMQQWSVLTGLAVVVILLAGWFLLVAPKRGEAADLREQTTAQEQRYRQVRTQLVMLKAQDAKLPAQRARLGQIAAKLPGDTALPTLVRSLTDTAARSGVDIVSMTPGQPAAVTAPTSGSGSASSATGSSRTRSAGQLASIPVTLQVHGGFFQLEGFVHRLETLRRALLVTGVTLAPGPKLQPEGAEAGGGADAWTGNLVATLTGRVFMVSNRPTVSAAPPSAAPSAAASAAAR